MKRCIAFLPGPGGRPLSPPAGGGDTEGGTSLRGVRHPSDTVLLSVDGRDVSAQRYLYWLALRLRLHRRLLRQRGGIQWGTLSPARAWRITPRPGAAERRPVRHSGRPGRRDYGCTSPTRTGPPWTGRGGRAAQYGGEEAYLAVLARMGLDRAAEAISGDYYLYEHLYDLYCTEGSELAPRGA